jgi:hypothetical protein
LQWHKEGGGGDKGDNQGEVENKGRKKRVRLEDMEMTNVRSRGRPRRQMIEEEVESGEEDEQREQGVAQRLQTSFEEMDNLVSEDNEET